MAGKTTEERYPGEAPTPEEIEKGQEFMEETRGQAKPPAPKPEPAPPPPFEPELGEGPPPVPPKAPTVPDKPGGQTAKVNGEDRYIKGSTMREVYGFHTPQEYLEAQRAGVMYGVHKGSGAPEGSALVRIRQGGKDVTVRYSGEKEGVSQSVITGLSKEKYRIPYTVEDKTVFLTGSQVEKLNELSGKPQFDYLKNIGAIKTDRVYIPGKGDDWTYLPTSTINEIRKDKALYNALMTGGIEAYEKAFNEKHIVIGGKVLTLSDWNELRDRKSVV